MRPVLTIYNQSAVEPNKTYRELAFTNCNSKNFDKKEKYVNSSNIDSDRYKGYLCLDYNNNTEDITLSQNISSNKFTSVSIDFLACNSTTCSSKIEKFLSSTYIELSV